jgi:hypothetical protein
LENEAFLIPGAHGEKTFKTLCFWSTFCTFAPKVLQKHWKCIGFLNAILENEKVAKTIIKHVVFAHFRIQKFYCKNPYNSLCFGMLFWTFAQKVFQKPWKFIGFLNANLENEKVAKTLIKHEVFAHF